MASDKRNLGKSTSPRTARLKKRRIVILGGGYAGSRIARHLDKDKFWDVTLVDSKSYFENTIAVLPVITEPRISKSVAISKKLVCLHTNYLPNSRVVVEPVKEVTPEKVITDKTTIFYDYLVIATGTSYKSKIKSQDTETSYRLEALSSDAMELKEANKVVIGGGGIVGAELAGEIITHYPEKDVTIVHSKSKLVDEQASRASEIVYKYLKKKGVKIILDSKLRESKKDPRTLVVKKGTERTRIDNVDKIYWCTGPKPNSSFMEKHFSNNLKNSHIVVNQFFQIKGYPNIFAAGDVTHWKEAKTAERAIVHYEIIKEHLKRIAKGKPLKKTYKATEPKALFISLGSEYAVMASNAGPCTAGYIALRMKLAIFKYVMITPSKADRAVATRSQMEKSVEITCDKTVLILSPEAISSKGLVKELLLNNVKVKVLHSTKTPEIDELVALFPEYGEIKTIKQGIKSHLENVIKACDIIVYDPKHSDAVTEMKLHLDAIKKVGHKSKHFVYIRPGEASQSFDCKTELQATDALIKSGVNHVILTYPGMYEWLSSFAAPHVQMQRTFYYPLPKNLQISWLSSRDVVNSLTSIIGNIDKYSNKVVRITGPDLISGPEICKSIAQSVSDDVDFKATKDKKESCDFFVGCGFPEKLAVEISAKYYSPGFTSDVNSNVKSLSGYDPQTISCWIEENAHMFL